MTSNILDTIAQHTRLRVESDIEAVSREEMRAQAQELAREELAQTGAFTFPFEAALREPGLSFICEVKKASPSKGVIAEHFLPLKIAFAYEGAGAAAISCLTEPHWFKGSDAYLQEIADRVDIPVLRKDFTVDEYQIYQAKVLGASAILLICAILTDEELARFHQIANELGLSVLVEAHDSAEVQRALACGARIVGVNNRNLKDFSVDFTNATSLRASIPEEVLFVAESGVSSAQDVAHIAASGADAVLVGEALMRAENTADKLAEFKQAAAAAISAGHTSAFTVETPAASSAAALSATSESPAPSATPESPAASALSPSTSPAVKFCGVSQLSDVPAINSLKPHFVGMVLWSHSKRAVTPDEAVNLRATIDPAIKTVGVFVDEDPAVIAELAHEGVIQVAQLHGSEPEEEIAQLRILAPDLEIWKAFEIRDTQDLEAANASSADFILLDAGKGEGETFDWALLHEVARPYALAGGLNPENVAEALKQLSANLPAVLDVSTGIEAESTSHPGIEAKTSAHPGIEAESTSHPGNAAKTSDHASIKPENTDHDGRPKKDPQLMEAFLKNAERKA